MLRKPVRPIPETVADFTARFGGDPRVFQAPGRVNLIGEHTDYNDGFVLPFALEMGTRAAAARRSDRRVRVFSRAMGEEREFDLDAPPKSPGGLWIDGIEGMARVLEA